MYFFMSTKNWKLKHLVNSCSQQYLSNISFMFWLTKLKIDFKFLAKNFCGIMVRHIFFIVDLSHLKVLTILVKPGSVTTLLSFRIPYHLEIPTCFLPYESGHFPNLVWVVEWWNINWEYPNHKSTKNRVENPAF